MPRKASQKKSDTTASPRVCIGYSRVSTDEQAKDGQSLEVQQARIQEFCAYKRYQLLSVVPDEGETARNVKRQGLQSVLYYLGEGEANTLIVCYLDRLHRNLSDLMDTIKLADAQGWTLIILDLGGEPIDTKTAIGRLIIQVLGAVAEMQSNMTSERVKSSMDKMKAEGYVFGPSRRIDEELSKWMCTQYMAGGSHRQIAEELTRRGELTAHGNTSWHPGSVRNHIAWKMGTSYRPHPAHR